MGSTPSKAHGPHDKKGDPKPLVEWTMSELIDAALKGKWIELEIKKFSDSLRDYRNLVHPRQQLKMATKPTEATSDICWSAASHALKQFVSRAAGAQSSPWRLKLLVGAAAIRTSAPLSGLQRGRSLGIGCSACPHVSGRRRTKRPSSS